MNDSRPVRVAIVNDYEIVVRGLERLLADRPPLEVVELDCLVDPALPVDLVLLDTFAAQLGAEKMARLNALPNVGHLVVYTWEQDEQRVARDLAAGARGHLSKGLSGEALAHALHRVHAGEVVVSPFDDHGVRDTAADPHAWPGRAHGLSSREAEVLGLITQGKTNEDIARQLYLSPNTLKRYIRTAYRKIGVERRSQAVAWGYQHGMAPIPGAILPSA